MIEVTDLAKTYTSASVMALNGVTLDVAEGEIFGYLGRNGAGKSTTVRILTTMLRATRGSARICCFDVARQSSEVRARLGVVLQEAGLDDLMTGREHLVLGGRLTGESRSGARRRADELLETFGLTDAADRLAARYSGGMRRKLAVAMALIRRPPVLFLDEPTAGLDPQSRRAFCSLLRQVRDEGTTVFLTTQHLAETEELADRVAILHSGRVAVVGTPQELKARLGTTTVRVQVCSLAGRDRVRAAMPGFGITEADDGWLLIPAAGGDAAVPSLLALLVASGVGIERLAVSSPTLEDVFVRVTGGGIALPSDSSDAACLPVARGVQGFAARYEVQR